MVLGLRVSHTLCTMEKLANEIFSDAIPHNIHHVNTRTSYTEISEGASIKKRGLIAAS